VKMNHESRNMKLATGLLSMVLAGWLLAGCSQTAAPEPSIIQRAQGETPAPPPPSGFLGNDYSLLTPAEGSDQKAMLRYVNPSANFGNYSQVSLIVLDPVSGGAALADANGRFNIFIQEKRQTMCRSRLISSVPRRQPSLRTKRRSRLIWPTASFSQICSIRAI
jgi:hypothetical protein